MRCLQPLVWFVVFFGPPYYLPGVAILNNGGWFDELIISFMANVSNMNFFSEVPNQKSEIHKDGFIYYVTTAAKACTCSSKSVHIFKVKSLNAQVKECT